jgi:hypothetical protein
MTKQARIPRALTSNDVSRALRADGSTTASFGGSDPVGYDVFTTAAPQFPTEGNSYLVISSGCASEAFSPNEGNLSCELEGIKTTAGQDMVQLTVDTDVPEGAQCWMVDWKSFSEEYPEYVDSMYTDAFLIEVGSSDISEVDLIVTAPNNVAYDANGALININTTGALGMTASNAEGTTYDGATDLLTTRAPLPEGASTLRLIFTVLDLGDGNNDSAAFIDNVRFSTSPCDAPETQPAAKNWRPVITLQASSVTVEEGVRASLSGSYGDTDLGDTVTLTASAGTITQAGGWAWSWSFDTEDGPIQNQPITVTADDGKGGISASSFTLNILNAAPTATLTSSASSINEGGSVTVGFRDVFDPSAADMAAGLRYEFACGGELGPAAYETGGTNASTVCTFADNGTYTLHARVMDKDGGFTNYTSTVVVDNVAPAITSVMSPPEPLRIGTAAQVTAAFADPGVQDTHTCTFSWDDGTTSTVVASSSGGSGSCTAARTYTRAGVYSITVSVMDKDGGVLTARSDFVVVYDPDGGSVIGRGWILSPVGAYTLQPSATGKASIGFLSKYQRGTNIPTGETEFQFKVGDFNFRSGNYESLVVAGARAQYRGTGRINNEGEYGFIVTALDGQVNGGGGTDQMRIKIWNKQTGATVYDNRLGQPDDMDATQMQPLGGGSIVILK